MPRLFLTREIGEAVLIGEDVRVTVNALKAPSDRRRGQLRIELEFEAPFDVKIRREELAGPAKKTLLGG